MARMLFIGIEYYSYIPKICAAFAAHGYYADYHPIERTDFWAKSHKKFGAASYRRRLDAYHARLIEAAPLTRYDVVFFLQVHHMSDANIRRLRETQSNARFILYNWDSLKTHDYRPYLTYFDRVATFDPEDAAELGINYLPLFATHEFFAIDCGGRKDFDLYFVGAIGTMHRFDALKKLHRFCSKHGIRTHFHLKCSPAVRLSLLAKREHLPGLTLRSLNFSDIVGLIRRSRAVFDFANHAQSGYTMRFIENMCAGQKIVTENYRIMSEEFYTSDRFLVIDDCDFSAIPAFLETPINSQIGTDTFSIDCWAGALLE